MLTQHAPHSVANVLIVEDETNLRQTLMQMIETLGYRVQGVASAEAAKRILGQTDYDIGIVLLDLCLPGEDGMSLFEWMHKRDLGVSVIVLTGFGDLPAAQRTIRLGVVEFLTKPCYRGDLERALHAAQAGLASDDQHNRLTQLADRHTAQSDSQTLDAIEYRHIVDMLHRHGGHRRATARALGISLRSLYYRLSRYNLPDEP